ncbi:hypothetical protein LIER_09621 [Lithospermum erythrorhizon]|uniref:Integrase catalytic domain-containing protein n=1 Tax=Lithospermum erythrorhizon TaxID=34254 RepID=A0AAV3PKA5_LITER
MSYYTILLQLYGQRGSKYQPRRTQWVKKANIVSQVAYTSLKTSAESSWYFDSGCSRHMTCKKAYLTQICSLKGDHVTFDNGGKGKIICKEKLNVDGLPHLTDVLLVGGLTANLISISQLCDDGMKVCTYKTCQQGCTVNDSCEKTVMHGTRSADNCYMWSSVQAPSSRKGEHDELWPKRLGHTNYINIQQIISKEAVRGILPFDVKDQACGDCQVEKQSNSCHQKLRPMITTRVLELMHMDLMGPMQVESIGGKKYVYVCVDDFSRYIWVEFLREKSNTFKVVKKLILQVQNEKEQHVARIRSGHGKEFENSKIAKFCADEGITHEFSAPITPQHNGVVERKNKTNQEMSRVMIHAKNVPLKFWAEAINTACHIHNRITLRPGTNNTNYEIWRGRKPNIQYFHVFGSFCYILTDVNQGTNLMSRVMKAYSWDTPDIVGLYMCSTKGLRWS